MSLKFVLNDPINNIPALAEIMAWRQPGEKPLSELIMLSSLTHICFTGPQIIRNTTYCVISMHLQRYVDTSNYCHNTIQLSLQIPVDILTLYSMRLMTTHLHAYQVILTSFAFGCGLVPVDFTHILQDDFTGYEALLGLPQIQWSNPEGYG